MKASGYFIDVHIETTVQITDINLCVGVKVFFKDRGKKESIRGVERTAYAYRAVKDRSFIMILVPPHKPVDEVIKRLH